MFVRDERRALVGQLGAVFSTVEWSRTPALVCVESRSGWGRTRIVRELYVQIARTQDYWPHSLPSGRHEVAPAPFEVDGDLRPPWLWSAVRLGAGSAEHLLAAHVEQLDAQLALQRRTAARNRAVRAAVASTAGFAAGHQYPLVGDVISGGVALLSIARAVGAQRDLNLARDPSGRLAVGEGASRRLLISRLRDAEREGLTVLLVFDDAHEAGESVSAFLDEVLRGPLPVGVMCLCTARSDRLDSPFGKWSRRAARGSRSESTAYARPG